MHTTPLSVQIAEWYVHKDLCNKTVIPGSCGTFQPNLPLPSILSPQVIALGSAQFPGYNSMGYTDL